MNRRELLRQADYTFQRGNRELAEKYLTDLLTAHPDDEAAWILLAKVVEEKERKLECWQRALKINPGNNEVRIALARLTSASPTLPRKPVNAPITPWLPARPYRSALPAVLMIVLLLSMFGATTLVVARNNPESNLARLLQISTPALYEDSPLPENIAPQVRAQVGEKYPQYAPLVDALIRFALQNSENGMEGAPERPGAEIMVSEQSGMEAKKKLEQALPQPGALTTVTLTEQQLTSWLAAEMKNSPDLPLSDVQVYLRNGRIQIWGMVHGEEKSTAALVAATVTIDADKQPRFKVETVQIGQQIIPRFLLSQAETWLNEFISEKINAYVPGLQLMNVSIKNGMITASGMR